MVKSKRGGIFALVGVATGLGNAFRFPALCAKFGLSFIVAYALCLALVGYPLLCAELNYGLSPNRGKGILKLFMRMAVANSAVISLYYGVIACKLSGAFINFSLSSNVDTYGYMPYLTAFFIFPAVFLVLNKGRVALNVTGKISVISSLILFSYLAVKGITFSVIPLNLPSLLCGEVWAEAVGQTLLSLSLAGGVMPTFARTMQKAAVRSTALKIVVANLIGCIFSALSVCPFCAGLNVEGGISCAFTVYPQVIRCAVNGSIAQRLLGACVYGVLTAVSIHSLCSLATPLLSKFNSNAIPKLIFCTLSAMIAPVLSLNQGEALSCCDRVACCVTAVLIAFFECVAFAKRVRGSVAIKLLTGFICPIVCGLSACLSVCSARFSGFNPLSLALGALCALFPIGYALAPLMGWLKLKYRKLRPSP